MGYKFQMDRCPPNRVWRDQCDETLAFVVTHPGCTAEDVGAEIYPWPNPHDGYRLRAPERTRTAFARRRLLTLLDAREVLRSREDGLTRWQAANPAS